MRQIRTAGEMYIRKNREDPKAETIKWLYSRNPVFQLWKDLPGTIRVLTLPGLYWELENKLNHYRHGHIAFTAAEKEQDICIESQPHMPKTKAMYYEHGLVEDLIRKSSMKWTAAWLDFSGHLTTTKVECLRQLWPRLSHSLVVTFLAARADGEITRLRKQSGSWGRFLAVELGVKAERWAESRYHNGTNGVVQVTLLKSGKPPEPPVRYINGIKVEDLIKQRE